MKVRSSILFLISTLIFTSLGFSLDSFAQTPELPSQIHAPDRLIVKFNPGVSESQQNSILSSQNSSVSEHLPLLDVKIISVPEQVLDVVKNALSKNKSVQYAEYDIAVPPTTIPNDTSFGNQWYLPMINAPEAYDITYGDGPPIVILDSGIDMNHSDLSSKIIYPYNGLTQVAGPVDHANGCGHGTPVAGSAAAITNNSNGVAGVGWTTQIIPVKITDDTASGSTKCYGWSNGVLKGVEWAVSHDAKVVNLSYGFGASGSILTAAQLLQDNDGWLVISAGNDYGQVTKTDHPSVIFVSSTTSSDVLSGFSSYGDYVDMSGPGSSILSTVDGNGYSYVSGTSFAAPITASVLNLVYSINPTLSSSESFDILKNSAVDLGDPGWDIQFGHGRVDAHAAVLAASDTVESITAMPENLKVAFIGDQGLGGNSESVLTLINNENVDMVLHQGDFDYADNPTAWDNQINAFLPGVPYFASVGNHDVAQWSGYQEKLQDRLANIPGAVCTGDLGVKSSCHYQGLFFILSGVGTLGSGHDNYIQNELAADNSIWSICSWHKNQRAMQVGGKSDEVGWAAYEACKDGGAIIATAHEHSYERTKTLTSPTNQVVDPAWTNPSEVRVAEGSTFAFVSGLGGQSIRDQERCNPTSYPYGCNGEWASIYTSTQGAQSGALFCEFNVNGQEDKATCYFKNISGQTVDTFNITSFMGVEIPQEPPISYDQSVSTLENIPKDVTLVATDANNDPLSFSIVSGPANGALSGVAPDLTYTPNSDYSGSDNFTFKSNDGTADSNAATVSITVNSIPPSGTLDIRINSSSDDAEQQIASGTMDLTSTDIEVGDDPGHNENQLGGLRFTNVVMPQGAIITAAHIEFETDEVDTVSTSVTIRAQDSDDTSTFSTTPNNISDRTTTTALVPWDNIPSWDTVSEKQETPDISTLVQEVVNRSGWTPGNSMAFIIDGTGSRTAESFNGESENAALLHIVYTTQPNNSPIADPQSVITDEDISLPITLTATDDDGDPLTISVVVGPSNGSLSGVEPNVIYTPNSNFNGADSFIFKANDGTDDSNIATISIIINSINDSPIADPQSVSTDEDTPLPITLTATDDDGDPLTFSIVASPSNGSFSGTAPNVIYIPNSNFNGNDIFTFKANDGTDDSNIATVNLTVNPVNNPPIANGSETVVFEDSIINDLPPGVLVNSSDPDGDPLIAILETDVSNGSLNFNVDGSYTYTPNENFNGQDSFSFRANDGIVSSEPATWVFTLLPVNDAPISDSQSVATDEDTPLPIILTASDVDGDSLTFTVLSDPNNGALSGTAPNLTYTPNSGFDGNDSLTFKANDGTDDSNIATVSITVNPINEIHLENITGESNAKKNWKATVTLTVFDSNESPFLGAIVTGTWQGGPTENCTTNSQGQCQVSDTSRAASQTFTVDDISGGGINYNSNENQVSSSITINQDGTIPGNTPPVADNQSVFTTVNIPLGITLTASDADGDSLTYTIISEPSNGSVSGTESVLTYTPNLDFEGSDSFTFRANDGTDNSNIATVSITVTPVNDSPVANDDSTSTDEDSAITVIVLTNDSDPDGDFFSISTFDGTSSQGASISDNGDGTFTYDPTTSSTLQSLNEGQNQDDTFSYTIEDEHGASDSALVTVTVSGSDDAPSTLSVTSINPNSVTRGSTDVNIQVVGTGFSESSTFSLENGGGPIPSITNTSFQNPGLIQITIDVSSNGPKNTTWDLRVNDGADTAVLSNALNITK